MNFAVSFVGYILLLSSGGYSLAALVAQKIFWSRSRRSNFNATCRNPVTILKPLYHEQPHLESCLRSFCTLDYPAYQIIFGVQDPNDPARATAERLRDEYPNRNIRIVVTPHSIGLNPKISNLAGMLTVADHAWLVIADSDIRVDRNYLNHVATLLAVSSIGLVTCLYAGMPSSGWWSRIGALFINDWFTPSVCVAWALRSQAFAFGATLALRRDTLDRIGGFQALANALADDYRLGERVRNLGLDVVLADIPVGTVVSEETFGTLWMHEIRWLRTIRFVNPLGFAFSWITLGLPIILAGAILAGGSPLAWWGLLIALASRLVLHYQSAQKLGVKPESLWLVPVRDCLTLVAWLASLVSRRVVWHGQCLHVQAGDLLDEHPGESK
ncbi:Glycosyl transferase, family 2, hopene-associated, HpnI [mine drainage metagenome]|uniref:Glycosyl transferase, family 2, hopene-associated, HpnI n=1 Tax=mine drainage metagenome TaxID=410659 RepID=T0ZLN1_9ZZZZ